jgi:iron complex transport system substrate-binding protein
VPYKQEVVAKLLDSGVTFLAMNPRRLQDVYADIRLLGGIVGRPAGARKQIQEMQRHFREIAARARRLKQPPARRGGPRVYCEAWPNPRITSPPWVEELVEIAGGRMVLPGGQRVTDDAVARAKPDIIVLAWTATGDRARPEKALANPFWKDVPAVRSRRVLVVADELLNTPGPPLVEGARALLRIFHPDAVAGELLPGHP